MKSILAMLVLTSVCSSVQPVFAGELDPTYKDEAVGRIHRVFEMNGALQPDSRAIDTGANEWSIEVKLVELSGTTRQAADQAWAAFMAQEQTTFIGRLRENYPETIPAGTRELSDELITRFNKETDGRILVQKGADHAKARQWLLDEVLTRAGRENVSFYLEGQSRKTLDFFRTHFDDTSMEVIGDDVLMIRGVKKVVVVRISYVHS